MRELDRILESFLVTGFPGLDDAEKQRFAEFLDYPDPDLHAYLVGRAEPANSDIARLVHRIRSAKVAEA